MNDSHSIEALIERFLDDRESLSDAEFNQLLEALRSQPQLAERLKDQLMMEEHLSQQFAKNRQDFPAKFEARQKAESPTPGFDQAKKNGEEPIETYALRREEGRTNGSPPAGRLTFEPDQFRPPKPPEPELQKPSNAAGSERPRRTFGLVALILLVLGAGLLRLEYSDAARKVAVVNEVRGMALIYRDGVGTVASPGMPILPGDELRTQEGAELTISYRDETKAWLEAESTLVIQPEAAMLPGLLMTGLAKQVELPQGTLKLAVRPQPENRPMAVKTPQVEATVLGTRFIVSVREGQSRVEVSEGRIRVKFLHQKDTAADLAAGEQVLATNREFRVSSGHWPSDRAGLIFLLAPSATQSNPQDQGLRVYAEGAHLSSVSLRPRQNAKLRQGRLEFEGGAFLADDRLGMDLLAACRKSNEFTLETTFQTAELLQDGPARWITFSTSSESWNFSLAQSGRDCIFRLLSNSTEPGEQKNEVRLFEIPDNQPHHIAVTYLPGKLHCYLDGKLISVHSTVTGDLSAWTRQHLLFGDEWNGGRDWKGTLSGIAIYDRALPAEEVAQNSLHFQKRFGLAGNSGRED